MAETRQQYYALSDAARAMEAKLRGEGKLISEPKKLLIQTYIPSAIRYADKRMRAQAHRNKNKNDRVARGAMWSKYYHTKMDKSLKADGLRI